MLTSFSVDWNPYFCTMVPFDLSAQAFLILLFCVWKAFFLLGFKDYFPSYVHISFFRSGYMSLSPVGGVGFALFH